MGKDNKHENYEILNLIGYGLSKYDNDFISMVSKIIMHEHHAGIEDLILEYS